MKRAIFEWCGLFAIAAATSCLAFWGLAVQSHIADCTLSARFGPSTRIDFVASNGAITVCDDIFNLHHIEINLGPFQSTPAPIKVEAWSLPGIRYRCLQESNGAYEWSLEMSLLIPATLLFVFGGLCFWRCQQLRRAERAHVAR